MGITALLSFWLVLTLLFWFLLDLDLNEDDEVVLTPVLTVEVFFLSFCFLAEEDGLLDVWAVLVLEKHAFDLVELGLLECFAGENWDIEA